MKKTFFILFLFFGKICLLFPDDHRSYTITGTLPDSIDNVYADLVPVWPEDKTEYSDSALVKKGKFVFEGAVDNGKYLYYVSIREFPGLEASLILEPGTLSYQYPISDDIRYAGIKGTNLNDAYTDSIFILSISVSEFGKAVMEGRLDITDAKESGAVEKMKSDLLRFNKNVSSFIEKNRDNPVGEYLFLIYSQLLSKEDREELLPYLSEKGQQRYDKIEEMRHPETVSPEGQYLPFSGKAPDGSLVDLSTLPQNKKLVLLDFWASWCVPCLKEVPTLQKLYADCQDKGLEIVSISIDTSEKAWKGALDKTEMPWVHLIDNKDKEANIATKYGVVAIPYTVLIDSSGEIVGVNLRGQSLIDKINDLLK